MKDDGLVDELETYMKSSELIQLKDLYYKHSNAYDFTESFSSKLSDNKRITNDELIMLVGLATNLTNEKLRLRVYEKIIEDVVLRLVES